jgi:formamidase
VIRTLARVTARSPSAGRSRWAVTIDFHVDLIKGGMETYGVTTNPIFLPGNVEPRYSEFLSFIGISLNHETDTNYYNDATLAYRNA